MQEEYSALLANNTWTLTSLPFGAIGYKWVFRNKHNTDDSIQHHKARLVAKEFQQVPGLDCDKTFNPVVKPTTIKIVLAYDQFKIKFSFTALLSLTHLSFITSHNKNSKTFIKIFLSKHIQ